MYYFKNILLAWYFRSPPPPQITQSILKKAAENDQLFAVFTYVIHKNQILHTNSNKNNIIHPFMLCTFVNG